MSHILPPQPFYFDGETITMHLLSMKTWMWRSEDDHYRVGAKWVGDDLYWLPPFGQWSKQATFRNGQFEVEGADGVWKYEHVPLNQVPEELQPLVIERKKHDYSITPQGGRDPTRLKELD
jgi:hypothetical protein